MQYFFVLLLALKLHLSPKVPTVPTLEWINGGSYKLTNPLHKTIEATIECGRDFNPIIVIVPAGTSQEVEISDQKGIYLLMCHLDSYTEQRDVGQ